MDEVVVVTGASSGVGRAVARRFAEDGANVALLARGEAGRRGAAEEIVGEGGRALAVHAALADAEQVEHAAAEVEAQLGPIDVWVNNAMTTVFGFFDDIEPDEFGRGPVPGGPPPRARGGESRRPQRRQLLRALRRVLRTAVDRGADPDALPERCLLPRREEGASCSRCERRVEKTRVAGRTTYLCPRCQRRA